MFVAMNQFKVNPGREADFEAGWKTRESYLSEVPGFVHFALLKGDEPGDYISHTIWESRQAFVNWTQSDVFRKAHAGGMPEGILATHPRARFYEAVLEQGASLVPTRG
ncbi:antibiotic biosynthesis monooxygenase [Tepidiforma sp.]|uniref:antibiotic biosynthesis monooxygenase family protein n=1 Tax=Tepidiforma sp. TaxID=2682230 RepID=UPI002ADDE3B8|nr:antibiotic biosynthesis monooxygenase [Tepidiforma sp.]